jgi:hypothetical protein
MKTRNITLILIAAGEGTTNPPSDRIFKIELLPEGTIKNVNFTGKKIEVSF